MTEALKIAIETYAELSGETFEQVAVAAKDTESQTFKNVLMLMIMAKGD